MPATRPVPHRCTFRTLGAVCLTGTALAGCGEAKPAASDREQVTDTLRTFLRAQADGDGEAGCAVLAPAAQRQLVAFVTRQAKGLGVAPTACADAATLVHVVAPAALLTALRTARIGRVVVRQDAATATVSDGSQFSPQRVVLEKSGGHWRIARVPSLIGG